MNGKAKALIQEIEELVWKYDISYFDSIILYCQNKGIEVESVASIIRNNDYIKSKIEIECENLNLLPKTNRLPI